MRTVMACVCKCARVIPVHSGPYGTRRGCWHKSLWRSWCWCHQYQSHHWSHCWLNCCHPNWKRDKKRGLDIIWAFVSKDMNVMELKFCSSAETLYRNTSLDWEKTALVVIFEPHQSNKPTLYDGLLILHMTVQFWIWWGSQWLTRVTDRCV